MSERVDDRSDAPDLADELDEDELDDDDEYGEDDEFDPDERWYEEGVLLLSVAWDGGCPGCGDPHLLYRLGDKYRWKLWGGEWDDESGPPEDWVAVMREFLATWLSPQDVEVEIGIHEDAWALLGTNAAPYRVPADFEPTVEIIGEEAEFLCGLAGLTAADLAERVGVAGTVTLDDAVVLFCDEARSRINGRPAVLPLGAPSTQGADGESRGPLPEPEALIAARLLGAEDEPRAAAALAEVAATPELVDDYLTVHGAITWRHVVDLEKAGSSPGQLEAALRTVPTLAEAVAQLSSRSRPPADHVS